MGQSPQELFTYSIRLIAAGHLMTYSKTASLADAISSACVTAGDTKHTGKVEVWTQAGSTVFRAQFDQGLPVQV